jgi:hypothetical protein
MKKIKMKKVGKKSGKSALAALGIKKNVGMKKK